jgi:hypothetical protein
VPRRLARGRAEAPELNYGYSDPFERSAIHVSSDDFGRVLGAISPIGTQNPCLGQRFQRRTVGDFDPHAHTVNATLAAPVRQNPIQEQKQ